MRGLNLFWFFGLGFIFAIPIDTLDKPLDGLDFYYQSGLDAYQSGEYENAKTAFEQVLENNWESPELYYNLGNVYFRLNDISGAVWAFEMCLFHDPTHEDAAFNLKLTNVNVKDRIAIPEAPIYLKLYLGVKERYTPNEWVKFTLGFLILFLLFVIIRKFGGYSTAVNVSENLAIILVFISFSFTFHSLWSDSKITEGIIDTYSIDVLSEPNTSSIVLFQVHEGLKVSIAQHSKNWLEVELVDGKRGWINEKNIRIIH